MKKIDTSFITDSAQLNLVGRTLDFLQQGAREQAEALAICTAKKIKGIEPDYNTMYVIYGCNRSFSTSVFSNDTLTIAKGAVFYQGEIFQVPAMSAIREDISKTHIWDIDLTNYQTGEPTLYTDTISRNTNQDRIVRIYSGVSGSGIVDNVNVQFFNTPPTDIGNGLFIRREGNQWWITGEVGSSASTTLATFLWPGGLGIDRLFSSGDSVIGVGFSNGTPNVNVVHLIYNGNIGGTPQYSVSIQSNGTPTIHAYIDCPFTILSQTGV